MSRGRMGWSFPVNGLKACITLSAFIAGIHLRSEPALPAEALDGQVQAWRNVRADEDIATNVNRLRGLGFSVSTVSGIMPEMMRLWAREPERVFGSLSPETTARIRAVDRAYSIRWRNLELQPRREVVAEQEMNDQRSALEAEWLAAVRGVLTGDEAREFGILNAPEILRLRDQLAGIVVSADEFRALAELHHRHAAADVQARRPDDYIKTRNAALAAQLKLQRETEAILGAVRFRHFLRRADPGFRDLEREIVALPGATEYSALAVWWMWSEHRVAVAQLDSIADIATRRQAQLEVSRSTRSRMEATLSTRTFSALEISEARHLVPRVPTSNGTAGTLKAASRP